MAIGVVERHVDRPQQPGKMGHDADRVGMHQVEQVEAGKGECEASEHGGVASAEKSPEEAIGPGQHEGIDGQ